LLALTSDFFLGAHCLTRGGTSLDNTFRLNALAETDWILCSTRLASFSNGAVHGSQCQFAQDGTLLSVSSQTGLLPRNPH
jgi:acyl-CoA thioesterase